MTHETFVRQNTCVMPPPLVPELKLHLVDALLPLWHATEETLAQQGTPPPYWAFAWAGGQALARYVLDHPGTVAGKRVLDLGAGSGLVALAAAKAGTASVLAADLDPFACAAVTANAKANGLAVATTSEDLIGGAHRYEVILVGDLFYERPLAERLMAWLADAPCPVFLGDPGRSYFPRGGLIRLATYTVPTSRELEDRDSRETGVYRLHS